jgi:leucyl aminopeptidase (aminopeptidase T)
MARIYDPFPIPDHQGLQPTHVLDWPAIAETLVQRALQLQRHERVIISADPYFGGAALDAVRVQIQKARAIELATIVHWTPALAALRAPHGRYADAEDDAAETKAMRDLFNVADVFVLLMNDRRGKRTLATSQSDVVVDGWKKGRAVHLHWFHDPAHLDPAHPVNLALDRVNQAAVIDVDYPALERSMTGLARRMHGATARLTDARGTDLSFRIGDRFHVNYGDASRAKMARFDAGRDREEEIPAGSLRTIPEPDSVEGVLVFPPAKDGESPALGRGMDCRAFAAQGLRFVFRAGRVVEVSTGGDQAELSRLWAMETGDRDRLGELVLGCNPLLTRVAGSTFFPHYGFGAGVVRLILGDNQLSGGSLRSSFHRWLMWGDADLAIDGVPVITQGRLLA